MTITQAVRKTSPDDHPQQVINSGRQLYRFFHEMTAGDVVATYDLPRRIYYVGTIIGDVQNNPDVTAATADYLNYTRAVKWQHQVERDKLSQAARNSFGSTLTIFRPSEKEEAELWKLIKEPPAAMQPPEVVPIAETEVEDPLDNALENSRELIKRTR